MSNLTLEALEKVMEGADAVYKEAKEALLSAAGDIDAAIEAVKAKHAAEAAEKAEADAEAKEADDAVDVKFSEASEAETVTEKTVEPETANEETKAADDGDDNGTGKKMDEVIDRLKKLVAEGNVSRIVMKRKGDVLLNIPVNVGLVGGILGLSAAPWLAIAAAAAAYGFECKFEIVKKDGTTDVVE